MIRISGIDALNKLCRDYENAAREMFLIAGEHDNAKALRLDVMERIRDKYEVDEELLEESCECLMAIKSIGSN